MRPKAEIRHSFYSLRVMMALGFHLPSNCNAITGQKSVTRLGCKPPCEPGAQVDLRTQSVFQKGLGSGA